MEFKKGKQYENRKGQYTVLEVGPRFMRIRYQDGEEQEIHDLELQTRIVENTLEEKSLVYVDCICQRDDEEILGWIQSEALPDEALVNTCCWKRICQVRGRNFSQVDEETWSNICFKRGYLFGRQNPRGF